jgi:TPR repeat protein
VQQQILFNQLQARLSERYDLVSQAEFEQAQTRAFNELDFDECTEENCVRMIQELLQAERYFALQLVRSGADTQLTLTGFDLERRQVRSEYCAACDQQELNASLDQLVEAWLANAPLSADELMSQTEADLERQAAAARDAALLAIAEQLGQGKPQRVQAGGLIARFRATDEAQRFGAFFEQQPASVQYELGEVYRRGAGVPSDVMEALRWHQTAAARGYAPAQTVLGYCFHHGLGVARDPQQAAQWYERAAKQGYALAQFNLGSMYRKGYGVPADEAQARRLYRQAAANGNAQARQLLAWMEEQ